MFLYRWAGGVELSSYAVYTDVRHHCSTASHHCRRRCLHWSALLLHTEVSDTLTGVTAQFL